MPVNNIKAVLMKFSLESSTAYCVLEMSSFCERYQLLNSRSGCCLPTFFRVLFKAPVTPLLQCPPKPIILTTITDRILMFNGTGFLPSSTLSSYGLTTAEISVEPCSGCFSLDGSIVKFSKFKMNGLNKKTILTRGKLHHVDARDACSLLSDEESSTRFLSDPRMWDLAGMSPHNG